MADTPTPPARGDVTLESLADLFDRAALGTGAGGTYGTENGIAAVLRALEPVIAEAWLDGKEYASAQSDWPPPPPMVNTEYASRLITRLCGENKDTGNG